MLKALSKALGCASAQVTRRATRTVALLNWKEDAVARSVAMLSATMLSR